MVPIRTLIPVAFRMETWALGWTCRLLANLLPIPLQAGFEVHSPCPSLGFWSICSGLQTHCVSSVSAPMESLPLPRHIPGSAYLTAAPLMVPSSGKSSWTREIRSLMVLSSQHHHHKKTSCTTRPGCPSPPLDCKLRRVGTDQCISGSVPSQQHLLGDRGCNVPMSV